MISAEVICDTIYMGRRITTMYLVYPRFIHAEFMTHRMFSRNASSSRAIPFKTQLKAILKNPASFVHWGANQKGMQAAKELQGWRKWLAQFSWSLGLTVLRPVVWLMELSGVHKQVINRMLEPWAHIHVLVTATEWDNFLKLRNHDAAQPEIHALAAQIQLALDTHIPEHNKYHIPYLRSAEMLDPGEHEANLNFMLMVSAARCARLSYKTWGETIHNVWKDYELAERLLKQGHMSPFEHQALGIKTPATVGKDNPKGWRANFFGWESFRYRLERAQKKN